MASNIVKSKYSHDWTFGLGNYRGKAFTTGCWSGDCWTFYPVMSKVKTEILDLTTLKWSEAPEYPFAYYKA